MERVLDDGSIILQNCNEPLSLTLCQFVTDDDWRGSIVVEECVLQTRRQRLHLRARRLRFLLFVELTLAVQIYFLGEV